MKSSRGPRRRDVAKARPVELGEVALVPLRTDDLRGDVERLPAGLGDPHEVERGEIRHTLGARQRKDHALAVDPALHRELPVSQARADPLKEGRDPVELRGRDLVVARGAQRAEAHQRAVGVLGQERVPEHREATAIRAWGGDRELLASRRAVEAEREPHACWRERLGRDLVEPGALLRRERLRDGLGDDPRGLRRLRAGSSTGAGLPASRFAADAIPVLGRGGVDVEAERVERAAERADVEHLGGPVGRRRPEPGEEPREGLHLPRTYDERGGRHVDDDEESVRQLQEREGDFAAPGSRSQRATARAFFSGRGECVPESPPDGGEFVGLGVPRALFVEERLEEDGARPGLEDHRGVRERRGARGGWGDGRRRRAGMQVGVAHRWRGARREEEAHRDHASGTKTRHRREDPLERPEKPSGFRSCQRAP